MYVMYTINVKLQSLHTLYVAMCQKAGYLEDKTLLFLCSYQM